MTTEELKPHLNKFNQFVVDGKKVLPPRDKKITIYFDGSKPGVPERFVEDMYFQNIGGFKTFMTSWIEHEELLKLIK
jgi:hypothetical protein